MANALAYVAGGLLSGMGQGVVSQGLQMREDARAELAFARQRQLQQEGFAHQDAAQASSQAFSASEADKTRDFQSNEADKTRDFQASQAETTRDFQDRQRQATEAFTAGQNDANRENQRGLLSNTDKFQDEKGYFWVRSANGTAAPLKDADGNQVKGALPRSTIGGTSAELSAVEWHIRNGKTPDEAWELARRARENPGERRKQILTVAKELENDDDWANKSYEERISKATQIIDGMPVSSSTSAQPAAGAATTKIMGKTPPGKPGGTIDDPYQPTTQTDLDAIPKGGIYINPADGKKYRKN